MFRKQNDNQHEPKDETVRKEGQLEEQDPIQPMGNEAINVEVMNQMLREANADNMLDLDEYEDQKMVNVPFNNDVRNIIKESGADDPNNSMYLDSSHNIVNENNFINGINV